MILSKNWLEDKYLDEKLSCTEIAEVCPVSRAQVWRLLKKFNIETRKPSMAWLGKKLSKKHREKLSEYTRGYKFHQGYKLIYQPNYPCASKQGYVAEHRLIAEKALGRYLKENEMVHHVNEIRDDNRNSNFVICTRGYNNFLHGRLNNLGRKQIFT